MSPPPDITSTEALHWRVAALESERMEASRLLLAINTAVQDIKIQMASHAMPAAADWAKLINRVDTLETRCNGSDFRHDKNDVTVSEFRRLHWMVVGGTTVIGLLWAALTQIFGK